MADVLPEEMITRYVIDKSQMAGHGKVRFSAFMPKDGKKSIYRISHPDLSETEIWTIGQDYVATPRSKTLRGRADLKAVAVYDEGLSFDPNGVPHPRHANIVGWPESTPDSDTDAQELIAIKLALAATLHKKPT